MATDDMQRKRRYFPIIIVVFAVLVIAATTLVDLTTIPSNDSDEFWGRVICCVLIAGIPATTCLRIGLAYLIAEDGESSDDRIIRKGLAIVMLAVSVALFVFAFFAYDISKTDRQWTDPPRNSRR